MKRISIDPITRLEGHGKIDIFLDDEGEVANAYLQIPELRGFEKFCVGRPAEDMPNLTARICGVCPEAHHMAATKALDALFHVDPPPAAKKLRELFYSIFYATDHTTHFYALGGPDFVVGPDAPPAERNILGVVKKVGMDVAGKVLKMRRDGHALIKMIGGRAVHPNWGLPGGVSRGINEEQRKEIEARGREAVEFAKFSLKVFDDIVLANTKYVELITGDVYVHKTYNMGMVDANNCTNPLVKTRGARVSSDVVGGICESGDYFCKDRPLAKVGAGDRLALLSAGAYGMVMASNYNTRPLPAEILIHGSRVAVARRRQATPDIWAGETVAPWLK